jgi:hypothetical protein
MQSLRFQVFQLSKFHLNIGVRERYLLVSPLKVDRETEGCDLERWNVTGKCSREQEAAVVLSGSVSPVWLDMERRNCYWKD